MEIRCAGASTMRFRCRRAGGRQAGRQAGNRVGRRSTLSASLSLFPFHLSPSSPLRPRLVALTPACTTLILARVLGRARKCAKNSFVAIGRMEALFAHL